MEETGVLFPGPRHIRSAREYNGLGEVTKLWVNEDFGDFIGGHYSIPVEDLLPSLVITEKVAIVTFGFGKAVLSGSEYHDDPDRVMEEGDPMVDQWMEYCIGETQSCMYASPY